MVITWHRERELSSGAVKIFFTLIYFSSCLIIPPAEGQGQFWQLTDLHWDQQYSIHGDPNGMCHGNGNQKVSETTAQASQHMTAGQYGSFKCDAPWDLIEFSIKGMADNSATCPDFIIWTGDNTPHVKNPMPDWPVVFSSLKNVSQTIRNSFPNTTLIPVLGNHDVFPGDMYPSEAEAFYRAYLTEGGWNELLDLQAQESFEKCGFYAMDVKSNLRVLALNTNLYNTPNNLTKGLDDPCRQLMWFEQQLQLAHAKGIKIIVAAHIPPGFFERWNGPPFFNPGQNEYYVKLVHRYSEAILTHVYGHTHTDSFRIFADGPDEIQSVAFVAPSVTPFLHVGGVNPSLRRYSYDSTGVEDYWQYFFNLTGLLENETPKWQLLYQATKAYGVDDLSNKNMFSIYRDMLADPEVFNRYYYHNTVGNVFEECDPVCIRDHICTISHLSVDDMDSCRRGDHVLFRNDPVMTSHFSKIHYRAQLVEQGSLILVSFLAAMILFVSVIGATLFIKHRRSLYASQDGHLYAPLPSHARTFEYAPINYEKI